MDAKCYITSCDVLDIGLGIVNELGYGIDCEQAKYCNFARYYIESDLEQPDIVSPEISVDPEIPEIPDNPDDPDTPIIEGIVNISFSYTDFVCQVIEQITTTTSTTTTTTTTNQDCVVDFIITAIYETTTTTTTSTTTSTTTTVPQLSSCNIQADILEITW